MNEWHTMRKGRNIILGMWGAIVFLLVGGKLDAQSYSNAVGLRIGESSGLTLKTFTGSGAFDFIISAWPNDLALFALYERNHPLGDNGVSWYYGGGAHITFNTWHRYYYRNEYYYNRWWYHERGGVGIGLDAIVGLEYKLPNAPFAFSLDIKPYMEVNRDRNIYVSPDPGLGIKYTF
jgi:hypothetical protein